jgi:hypothetical protein
MIKRLENQCTTYLMWHAYGILRDRLEREFATPEYNYYLFIEDDGVECSSKTLVFSCWKNGENKCRMRFPIPFLIDDQMAIYTQIKMKVMFS